MDLSFSFLLENFLLWIQCVLPKRLLHPTYVRLQILKNEKQWTFPPLFLSKVFSFGSNVCYQKKTSFLIWPSSKP